jgi:hypothetical protein
MVEWNSFLPDSTGSQGNFISQRTGRRGLIRNAIKAQPPRSVVRA